MEMHDLLEAVLERSLTATTANDEAGWHDIWSKRAAGTPEPIELSAVGGALSDRLPWVFYAGYQGAIRHIFPELRLDRRWISYVASESRDGNPPGTALAPMATGSHMHLSGTKTWVAAAKTVELLLVSVGRGPEQRFAPVARGAEGVTIDPGDTPSFLPELSQGSVHFDQVEVETSAIFGSQASHLAFGAAEPLHVLTALNAFMLSHSWAWDDAAEIAQSATTLLMAAAAIAARPLEADELALGIAGLDQQTRQLADRFDVAVENNDSALAERWKQDRRLVSFYQRGPAARAATARAHHYPTS